MCVSTLILLEFCQLGGVRIDGDDSALRVDEERMIAVLESPTLDDGLMRIGRRAEMSRAIQVIDCHNAVEDTLAAIQVNRHMCIMAALIA